MGEYLEFSFKMIVLTFLHRLDPNDRVPDPERLLR
jgi:hypothetical protein